MNSALEALAGILQPPYSYGLLVISIALASVFFSIGTMKSFEDWIKTRKEINPHVDVVLLRKKGLINVCTFAFLMTAFVSALAYASATHEVIEKKENELEKASEQIDAIEIVLAQRDEAFEQQTVELAAAEQQQAETLSLLAQRDEAFEQQTAELAAAKQQQTETLSLLAQHDEMLEQQTAALASANQQLRLIEQRDMALEKIPKGTKSIGKVLKFP